MVRCIARVEVRTIKVDTGQIVAAHVLDELQNPLVLSAEVAGRYRSKVTAIYVPGYVQSRELPPRSDRRVGIAHQARTERRFCASRKFCVCYFRSYTLRPCRKAVIPTFCISGMFLA
ncbi:hypothetical protein ACFL6S_23505 [Candidatus Poribacteria bacterium]